MAKTALAVGAVVSALATTYGTVKQDQAQGKARKTQRTANQLAQNAALKNEQQTERELMRAQRSQPDLAALLAEQQAGARGPSTMLTGTTGLSTSNLLGA